MESTGQVRIGFEFEDGDFELSVRRRKGESASDFIERAKSASDACDALIVTATNKNGYSWNKPFFSECEAAKPAEPEKPVPAIDSDALSTFEDL